MPVLKAEDIPDMVQGTLERMGKMKFRQIATTLNNYEVLPKWLKKDKVTFDSGYGYTETLMTRLSNAARHVGLFEKDSINITDLLEKINIRWAHANTHWGFEYRETLMNRGESLIVKILKPRRLAAMIDLADILERAAWTLPSPKDKKSPYGVPYWITTSTTQGFYGLAPTGYSTVGGLSPDDFTGWRNWTDAYADRTKADVIRRARKAHRNIMWKSPVSVPELRSEKGMRYRLYMNEDTLSDLEELGENQNENLGRDLAPMDGTITFKRHPLVYLPILNSRTDDPIYFINHDTFYPVILKGDYLRESKPKALDEMHNTFVVHVDLTYNYICVDRRRNAVLIKSS